MERHLFNLNTFLYHDAIQDVHMRTYFLDHPDRPSSYAVDAILPTLYVPAAMPAAHNSSSSHRACLCRSPTANQAAALPLLLSPICTRHVHRVLTHLYRGCFSGSGSGSGSNCGCKA